MPDDLMRRVLAARSFNQGFATVEYVACALVDLDFHLLRKPESFDVHAFEDAALARIGMPAEIVMRHRPTHFAHVFSGGGYASAYYSYMWSEVLDADAFAKAPAKSIDYAVMERTDKCWVVPAKFRWSDLGTWDALLDIGDADSAGNVTEGPVELDHVRNSYVRSDGPLTAVIGVEEVVVVAMGDAVLVGHRDNLPRLKDVVQRMSDGKHRAATEHAIMHRPWGSYQDIDRGDRFRAKRLTVNPGGKLSLQSHKRRAEHWVVVKGVAEVVLDGKIMTLRENESIYTPMGGIHRLSNPGAEPLEVVEVQTGDYLEEDDITRYEDIYARV